MSSPDPFTKGVLLSDCRIGNFDNKQFVAFLEFVVLKFYEIYDLKKHKRLDEHNKH